jgi:hypothetical protein
MLSEFLPDYESNRRSVLKVKTYSNAHTRRVSRSWADTGYRLARDMCISQIDQTGSWKEAKHALG